MPPSHTWQWVIALLLGISLAGCKSSSSHNYPNDPLLASRRPVEAKARTTPPTQVVSAGAIVPPPRIRLIASRPNAPAANRDARTTAIEPPPYQTVSAVRAVSE